MKAVILAGGRGRRLKPFTTTIPKPLFPVGEKPILQIILEQLITVGVSEFIISIGYLGELIEAFFSDGSKYGCQIEYVRESEPLGTAGAIALLPPMTDDYILMNGDILTTLNFKQAFDFHKSTASIMTVCTYEKKIRSSLGIIEIDEDKNVTGYKEKPENKYLVSSGIYILNPSISSYVQTGEKLDLPDLVKRLISENKPVKSYSIEGDWFDIGTPADLELALEYFKERV